MGEYAPDDQRMVHQGDDGSWQEQEEKQRSDAQPGYGNARDESGHMEQDVATTDLGDQPLAQATKPMPVSDLGKR